MDIRYIEFIFDHAQHQQERKTIMPIIYLSPSTQDWNPYVTGSGSEEYHMNQIADAMTPYLLSSGIQYTRNSPDMTAGSSIRQANSGYYDLYLALHSNASGEGSYGANRGIIAFYYPGSGEGERAAEIFAANLRDIVVHTHIHLTANRRLVGLYRVQLGLVQE